MTPRRITTSRAVAAMATVAVLLTSCGQDDPAPTSDEQTLLDLPGVESASISDNVIDEGATDGIEVQVRVAPDIGAADLTRVLEGVNDLDPAVYSVLLSSDADEELDDMDRIAGAGMGLEGDVATLSTRYLGALEAAPDAIVSADGPQIRIGLETSDPVDLLPVAEKFTGERAAGGALLVVAEIHRESSRSFPYFLTSHNGRFSKDDLAIWAGVAASADLAPAGGMARADLTMRGSKDGLPRRSLDVTLELEGVVPPRSLTARSHGGALTPMIRRHLALLEGSAPGSSYELGNDYRSESDGGAHSHDPLASVTLSGTTWPKADRRGWAELLASLLPDAR